MKNVSVNYREKYSYCVKMLLLCSFFRKLNMFLLMKSTSMQYLLLEIEILNVILVASRFRK